MSASTPQATPPAAARAGDSIHPSAPDDTYETWVGRVIDARYRIDGLLGEGGMGAVFEAQHLKLKKAVALKVIHPEFAGDGEVAKRFVREAMASAQIEHPHVASATDYGTLEEGGAYLVMQLVRGGSLRERLEDGGALGWLRACELGAQVADALSAAHKAKIVHRDLKPDNVMLEPRDAGPERVLVLDFGIARVADGALSTAGQALTRVGTVIGTPGYMAPEQALGEPVDARIDLYALGLLLWEMSCGEKLFDTEDLTAIVTRQLTEPPPRLSSRCEVPEELDELVDQLLQKDRDARPGSAAEVRARLEKLVLSAQLHRVTSGEHSLPDVAPVTGPFPHQKPEAAKRPTAMAATVVAAGKAAREAAGKVADKAAEAREHAPAVVERVRAAADAAPPLARNLVILGGLLVGLSALVAVAGLALSGDEAGPKIAKREMVREPDVEEAAPAPDEGAPAPEGDDEGTVAAPAPQIPAPLLQAHADLLLSNLRRTRRAAAQRVLRYSPREDVPPFLVHAATIEGSSRCLVRRDAVVALGELGDARGLPALERLDATPRNQCGNFVRRSDCLACLRDELAVALARLRPQ